MDAEARKVRRDEGKERFWREKVPEAEASGLSIREFCRERGLKEAQFYAWRRELKMREIEEQRKPGFVELIRTPSGNGDSGVSIRIGERVSIVVERGFDAETLKTALACLCVDAPVCVANATGRRRQAAVGEAQKS